MECAGLFEKTAELPNDDLRQVRLFFKWRDVAYVIATIINFYLLLYSFCFIDNFGDQSIPPELGYISLGEFVGTQ